MESRRRRMIRPLVLYTAASVQDLNKEAATAREACLLAGEIIRRHYERGEDTTRLKADQSPVTAADLEAEAAILALVRERFPDDGILSEETADDGRRLGISRVWIVDPLDGTRDFVARTGDFAVLVGLTIDGRAALGAVYEPAHDDLYWAATGLGAHRRVAGRKQEITTSGASALPALRIGVTRFNPTPGLRRFLDESGLAAQVVQIGASAKMMALARGDLEISVCLNADEKEWDTCAPEVIVREAGGAVTDLDGAPFCYNQPDVRHRRGILMSNGPLHEELIAMLQPYFSP